MKKFIAIDIGGTSIKYEVLNSEMKTFEEGNIETRKNSNENFILEDIISLIDNLKKIHKIDKIGISTAGVVDTSKGEVIFAGPTIPAYAGTKIKSILENRYNIEVHVENDVNSAALGEMILGAGQNKKSAFMITVGTGIGGAFIIENQIFYGSGNSAGEVGYINIEGKPIQELASTTALVRNVEKRINKKINGKEIFDLAQEGDIICIEEIDKVLEYLSTLIINIIYMVSPQVIILGGGIMEQKEYIGNTLDSKIKNKISKKFYDNTKIEFATLGNRAGKIGAIAKFI
ncbi:MAG: ROK family protein [Sarcina sp.]